LVTKVYLLRGKGFRRGLGAYASFPGCTPEKMNQTQWIYDYRVAMVWLHSSGW